MVFIRIVTEKNGETIFFDELLPKVHFMRLVSCSLYNSWHNLTRVGQISFKNNSTVLASIPQGHYTIETLAKELTTSFKSFNQVKIEIETNKPNSVLKIARLTPIIQSEIGISHSLAL